MKRIFTFITGIVFSLTIINAQDAPPQAFSFQATILDAKSKPLYNKVISLKISILQDNMNGFPVYSESFHPTTDQNSQISVEIGRGNVISGNFASIDWSAYKYFLKVELDLKGGTAYQLLSTTQLLSVPYALYAGSSGSTKDGVSIAGDQTITGIKSFSKDLSVNGLNVGAGKGTGDSNTAFGKSALNSNTTGNFNLANGSQTLFSNTTGANNVAIGYNAGYSNITGNSNVFLGTSAGHYETGSNKLFIDNQSRANESDARLKALLYGVFDANTANQSLTINGKVGISKLNAAYDLDISGDINFTGSLYKNGSLLGLGSTAHSIGESYGGGIVFYVYDNGEHGLIAATVDDQYSVGTTWYAGTYLKTMAIAGGIGAGKINTFIIYAVQGEGNTTKYAARAAIQGLIGVVGINYGDWYLPSVTELGLLYLQKDVVGGFVSSRYWSSNENNTNFATSQDFNDGSFQIEDKSTINGVRFIRSF